MQRRFSPYCDICIKVGSINIRIALINKCVHQKTWGYIRKFFVSFRRSMKGFCTITKVQYNCQDIHNKSKRTLMQKKPNPSTCTNECRWNLKLFCSLGFKKTHCSWILEKWPQSGAYFDWLATQLGIKKNNLVGWYSIGVRQTFQFGSKSLLSKYYNNSLIKALVNVSRTQLGDMEIQCCYTQFLEKQRKSKTSFGFNCKDIKN